MAPTLISDSMDPVLVFAAIKLVLRHRRIITARGRQEYTTRFRSDHRNSPTKSAPIPDDGMPFVSEIGIVSEPVDSFDYIRPIPNLRVFFKICKTRK